MGFPASMMELAGVSTGGGSVSAGVSILFEDWIL